MVELLERVASWFIADPEEYRRTEAEISQLVRRARGESITRATLLGTSHETHPLLRILDDGEQPHHYIPVDDLEIADDGHRREYGFGTLVVTDERIVLKHLDEMSVSVTTVDHSSVDAVELSKSPDHVRLAVDAGARTISLRTADPWLRDEAEKARKTIRWFR